MSSSVTVLPANNAVQLTSNGVILLIRTGYQTPISMDVLRAETEKHVHKLRAQHKKVFILIDDSRVTGYDKAVALKIADFLRTMDFDAIAIYGLNPVIRGYTDKIITTNYQNKRVHTFDNQHKASIWLAAHVLRQETK